MDLGSFASRFSGVRWLNELKFQCQCPCSTHGDGDPDLSLFARQDDNHILLGCFGAVGDTTASILAAVGLTEADLLITTNGSGPHSNGNGPETAWTLKHAIAYARRGFAVFPCHNIESDGECSCGKLQCASAGKHPRYKDWQKDATIDEIQIRRWWSEYPDSNVGVACGAKSKLTVLDVDGDVGRQTLRQLELDNGELPETPIAITGSGGAHYYFQHVPGLSNAVRFAEGLDIRTDGGLVVGVGSKTKRTYEWEAIASMAYTELAIMPSWLAEKIKAAGRNGNGKHEGFRASDEPIREGEGRNNYLYRMGRSLKAKNLPSGAIRAALETCNREQCKPPLDGNEFLNLLNQVLKQPDQQGFNQNGKHEQQEESEEIDPELVLTPLKLGALYELLDKWLEIPWVWQGILPHGSLSLLVGKSESGKSTFVYALIYSIIRGLEFLGRTCEKGRVLYLAGDPASEFVAAQTFRSLGLDPEEEVLTLRGALVGNPHAWGQLRNIVAEFKPTLIVLDTLAAAVDLDTEKYAQAQRSQLPLTKLARDFNPNILSLHHSQKQAIDAYNVVDAALGSVGVAAVASTRMVTRMYQRARHKFHTFQMSNLRIGQPIEGEWILTKRDDGLVELNGLWSERESNLIEELILKVVGESDEAVTQTDIKDRIGMKMARGMLGKKLSELVRDHKLVRAQTKARKYLLPGSESGSS